MWRSLHQATISTPPSGEMRTTSVGNRILPYSTWGKFGSRKESTIYTWVCVIKASLSAAEPHFRSIPKSRHRQGAPACPKSADIAVPCKVCPARSRQATMMSWNCGEHGSIVGAPVAPHIVAFVSAKTFPFPNILGSQHSGRIGVYCEVPRAYMPLASHGGSREHGC